MKIDPDHFKIIVSTATKPRHKTDSAKPIIKKCTGHQAYNKSYNSIIRKTAGTDADSRKNRMLKKQARYKNRSLRRYQCLHRKKVAEQKNNK